MAERDPVAALQEFRLKAAADAIATGDVTSASEWIAGVEPSRRPKSLVAILEYALAKLALSRGEWGRAEKNLVAAIAAQTSPLYERRLALLRNRAPLMDDGTWFTLIEKVDPASRLGERSLAPAISAVWACGAYYSRGSGSGAPWSRFLRLAKDPTSDDFGAVLTLATGFLCRWVSETTPALRDVDVVVPIPANPHRYGVRMMSLPDELARNIENQLAVPMAFDALRYTAGELELRGLSWAERRRAVVGSMEIGDRSLLEGRVALVVDDVTTSGATLAEAGRLLRAAGTADVFGVCLSHTEG